MRRSASLSSISKTVLMPCHSPVFSSGLTVRAPYIATRSAARRAVVRSLACCNSSATAPAFALPLCVRDLPAGCPLQQTLDFVCGEPAHALANERGRGRCIVHCVHSKVDFRG